MSIGQIARMRTVARKEYDGMMRRLGAGETFSESHICETARKAGISLVDAKLHETEARREFSLREEIDARLAEWVPQLAAAEREFERARRELETAVKEWVGRFAVLRSNLRNAETERATQVDRCRAMEREKKRLHTGRTLPPNHLTKIRSMELEREGIHKRIAPLLKKKGELHAELQKGKAAEYAMESAESEPAKARARADLVAYRHVEEQHADVVAEYEALQQESLRLLEQIRECEAAEPGIHFLTREEKEGRQKEAEQQEREWREGHRFVGQQVVGG
ncbi:MAG: hypothetical protein ABIK89_13200 [Planctomycetota bacterium]